MTHLPQRTRNRIWSIYNWILVFFFILLVSVCIHGNTAPAIITTSILIGLLSRYFLLKRKLRPDVEYRDLHF